MSKNTHLFLLADEWLKENPNPTSSQLTKLLEFVDEKARAEMHARHAPVGTGYQLKEHK